MLLDADTHIDECEATWAHMPEELAPVTMSFDPDQIPAWLRPKEALPSAHTRFWFIDGRVYSRRIRSDARTGTTAATRELSDIGARLSDMDRLGADFQVIYPTVFLMELTQRADVDIAMAKSYNRWLAERCADSKGRLRWTAILPMSSMEEAVAEMHWAKENGAIGVFKRGVEWGHAASDPYFFPVYQEAADLDLPICIHSSLPWSPVDPTISRVRPIFTLGFTHLTVLQAFHALVVDRIPERFPSLRFGFIEAGSSWLTHLADFIGVTDRRGFLGENRFYVTCEASEDLDYIVSNFGHENLIVGTDYSHGDRSSVMDAHQSVIAKVAPLGNPVIGEGITSANARRFYGL